MSPKPPSEKRKTWLPVVPKGLDRRAVVRLAEQGVDFDTIVLALDLGGRLAKEPKLREELERLVEHNAARFRAALQRRLYHEAVGGGRATPLIALGRTHVGLDGDGQDRPVEHGIVERLAALLDDAAARRKT